MNHRILPAIIGLALEASLFLPPASAAARGTSLADTLRMFPFQESLEISGAAPVSLGGDSILVLFRYTSNPNVDSAIYAATSPDGGRTWGAPTVISYDRTYLRKISAICLRPGAVVAVWPGLNGIVQTESDSTASRWSVPRVIQPNTVANDVRIHSLGGNLVWLTYLTQSIPGESIAFKASTDGGKSWSAPRTLLSGPEYLPGPVAIGTSQIAMFYSPGYRTGIVRSVSNDNGQTWTGGDTVLVEGAACSSPWPFRAEDGSLLMIYNVWDYSKLPVDPWRGPMTQSDVWYARSTDDGVTWTDRTRLTRYRGRDDLRGADLLRGAPFYVFISDRWTAMYPNRLWLGVAGSDEDLHLPPALVWYRDDFHYAWMDVQAWVDDEVGIAEVTLIPMIGDILRPGLQMYDDGLHDDMGPGDNVYGVRVDSVYAYESYDLGLRIVDVDGNVAMRQPRGGGGYYTTQHDTGNVVLFINGEGDLGESLFSAAARWPKNGGQQYLSKASFWIGAVANNVTFSISTDYSNIDGIWSHVSTVPRVVPSGKADQEYILSYANDIPGQKATVRQHSYQWSPPGRDDFIIFQYDVRNDEQTSSFQNMYAALWADPDVTLETQANDDIGGVDQLRQMIYLYDSNQNPPGMFGIVLLSHTPNGFVFYRSSEDPWDAAQHYGLLSRAGISPATTPDDYRMLVNAGPFTLPAGERCSVTYGIVLGNSLSELQTNADTMIQLYRSVLTEVEEPSKVQRTPNVFALDQNFPNPFNPTTAIRYQVPGVSDVRLAVYDLLGREVAVLVNEKKTPGSYEVTFDGSHRASGVYFYRLTAGTFVETKKLLLLR